LEIFSAVTEISWPDRDIFGFPCRPPRGQGRPAYEWTEEKSRQVNVLFRCGRDVKTAAAIMGCCLKTFRKVFYSEIKERDLADVRGRLETIERLSKDGSVAALKAREAMIEREQARALSDRMLGKAAAAHAEARKEKAPAPLGKKEQQKQAAESVAGLFATRSPPPGALQANQ
jgi:hypothetical protein